MKQTRAAALNAVQAFFFYSMNYDSLPYHELDNDDYTCYVPEFILKAKWHCNVRHMAEKWLSAVKSWGNYGAMMKFYSELDFQNRIAMLEWIFDNYSDFKKLM